jgi:hypothetical protein
LAGTRDGKALLVGVPSRALTRVVEVPLDGGPVRTLFTLSRNVWFLDQAADGAIYLDQVGEEQRLLRFPATGGEPEQLTSRYSYDITLAAALQDGRPLIYTNSGDRRRLVIVEKTGMFSPLVESGEACGPPVALLGAGQVAVMTDRKPLQIAIVSVADGRIVAHVPIKHDSIQSLAASTDGRTFYYSSGGAIWSMPVTGGEPRKMGDGDHVAFDPRSGDLIVSVAEKEAIHLVRLPAGGGAATPIVTDGDVRLPSGTFYGTAVGADGRIALQVASAAQWDYSGGLVDARAGKVAKISLHFDGDIGAITWAGEGRLMALGNSFSFAVWRFRPNGR